jgi:hypothetical protein
MKQTGFHRILCGATFAAAIAVSTVSAHAQAFEGEGLSGILSGFGLSGGDDEEKAAINFRERAPLVIPPSRELPPPGTTGSVGAAGPNFPIDADRKDANVERARALWDEQIKSGRRLTPEEMAAGDRLPAGSKRGYQKPQAGDRERNTRLSATQMRNVHTVQEEESWDKGEPARTRLSDPPAGYRTPSASVPYADKGAAPSSGGSSGGGFWDRINPF